jgi:L-asparaginase
MNNQNEANGVLVIYTGGTIGSVPKNEKEELSPLVPFSLDDVGLKNNPLFRYVPRFDSEDQKIPLSGNKIRVKLASLQKPIDSSNVSPEVWSEITKIIKDEYSNYEGFVILNGTDTMTYTTSVLSFMIDNLNKPIIITGSQKPIGETRSDAVQNLITAIEIAAAKSLGKTVVPEVCLFFRNKLFRGCRTVKFSASNYEAFQSPNFPELGTADEYIVINESLLRSGSPQSLQVSNEYSPKVMYLKIAPGMDLDLIETLVTSEKLEGIILLTYGTGNAPTLPGFLNAIDKSIKQGKVIVNVTQCFSGEVELGLYDVSVGLLSRGVISGLDMTAEAAYTKLSHLLGSKKDKAEIADLMQINLRGEQRQSIFNLHFGGGEMGEDEESITVHQKRDMVDNKKYNPDLIDKAFLRIMGITEPDGSKNQSARGKVFIEIEGATSKTPVNSEYYLGSFDKRWNSEDGPENIILAITEQARRFIDNKHSIPITIINENGRRLKWEKMEIGIFANV